MTTSFAMLAGIDINGYMGFLAHFDYKMTDDKTVNWTTDIMKKGMEFNMQLLEGFADIIDDDVRPTRRVMCKQILLGPSPPQNNSMSVFQRLEFSS